MALNRCPEAFWDFALEYVVHLRQILVRKAAGDRSPLEVVTGETPDTSEFMDFDFYQWVRYRDADTDKNDPIKLGRWLGIAHRVGSALTYWILKSNGQVIARSTVQPLNIGEYKSEVKINERSNFDKNIKEKYGEYDPTSLYVFVNDEMEDPFMVTNDDHGEYMSNVSDDGEGDAHTGLT